MRNATLLKSGAAVALSALGVTLAGCNDEASNPAATSGPLAKIHFEDRSVTPPLVTLKDVPGLDVFSLIGSDDTLEESPNFIFGGSADGIGILENPDKSFTMVVNHEDNFAVSRITLDKKFRPVRGEYIMNSDNGRWRLCSATLITPDEHGFGPLYLTAGESGEESMIHAIDPFGAAGQSNPRPALGHWSAENAVPLPADAFSGKTVIMIGDDDSGLHGGQLAMYVSNQVGDLNNGNLFVMARTDNNIRERDMVPGRTYDVVFRQIPNQAALTGAQINAASTSLNSIRFGRVEDIDYRKGNGNGHGNGNGNGNNRGSGNGSSREIYFNVTGQNNTDVNADYSRTKYGRTYRLKLNPQDPTKGTLEVILDGDNRNGVAGTFQNPDNICVTENYVYIQEDPNGYGDETHDSYLYQYNIATGQLAVAMELDHRRNDPKYNVGGASRKGSWEYGGLIDISDMTKNKSAFALCIQPHTWRGARYRNAGGGTLRTNEDQASQILVVTGLPR